MMKLLTAAAALAILYQFLLMQGVSTGAAVITFGAGMIMVMLATLMSDA